MSEQKKPYINIGCGKVILPNAKPLHHAIIPDGVHDYPYWVNVDRLQTSDEVTVADMFSYPWAWDDNSFDGALLTHIVEHIPHEVNLQGDVEHPDRWMRLNRLTDGFYAFFAELHRVLTPGAVAHVIVPFAWSDGAMQDPTHRRYLVPQSFSYLLPNPNAPFELEALGAWEIVGAPLFDLNHFGEELQQLSIVEARAQVANQMQVPGGMMVGGIAVPNMSGLDEALIQQVAQERFVRKLMTMHNLADSLYIALKVVK